ncbi:MAG: TIM-barrel domain-containing protein, partial [Planctomycetota bacterium]
DAMIRVQVAAAGDGFLPDERYPMVVRHDWLGQLKVTEGDGRLELASGDGPLRLVVQTSPLRLSWHLGNRQEPVLKEAGGVTWSRAGDDRRGRNAVAIDFAVNADEQFCGLGHPAFGEQRALNLAGESHRRGYGGGQSPMIVPFYMSSRGYGLLLNSTFPNRFDLGSRNGYSIGLETEGSGAQLDYFVIAGPTLAEVLDRYTQLTGRPRLPQRAMFGLALSDKGDAANFPSTLEGWKTRIEQVRGGGFPVDHLIFDNRWRAGGGSRIVSRFEWDRELYPDPKALVDWIRANGLVLTLDFNRAIARQTKGWQHRFNVGYRPGDVEPPLMQEGRLVDASFPDFTDQEVRDWYWGCFREVAANPRWGFPADAFWLDEVDQYRVADETVLANGRTWEEVKNQWFLIHAQLLVDGWDKEVGRQKRPFVWMRGVSAGAQRYATIWTGDIGHDYGVMREQIRAMLSAGLSGFPYWSHDAGGFSPTRHAKERGYRLALDDKMFVQWSMAFGSFSPFWRPHGLGKSRWAIDRDEPTQALSKVFCELRYALMPYTYTLACTAAETGMPMARAMVLDYQHEAKAWEYDLEYLWGPSLLVAPNASDGDEPVRLWLPPGAWYDFWTDERHYGPRELEVAAPLGRLPLYAKAGAVIPMAKPALSTAFLDDEHLIVHVYSGADGQFTLLEDDGVSEKFREAKRRAAAFRYSDGSRQLVIAAAEGDYENAPQVRSYEIVIHGLSASDAPQAGQAALAPTRAGGAQTTWDA